MFDETGNDGTQNAADRVGFCQDCGKPLTRETARPVGSGVFCEPCLEVRLGTAGQTAPPPYTSVPPTSAAGGPAYQEPFPPVGGHAPSPVLAAFLGLIPGVGAMYNGQFAKGIAHIVIFALLQSMARMNDFFGLLVAGWVFYQAFDAYHTARARREGLPLPDPFGLNNIGAQVAVHFRGTQGTPPQSPGYPPPQGWAGSVPTEPVVTPPPVDAWGNAATPSAAPYTQAAWTPPPVAQPPVQDWPATNAGNYAVIPPRPVNRFPGAAVWLIGFGLIFLVLNVVPELRFSVHKIFPFLLMGLGIGIFVRRMNYTGGVGPAADEGDGYTSRAICSLRWPVILFTVGLLWGLREFDLVSFPTWPVLVIVIGVMLLLERSLANRVVPMAAPMPSDANTANGDGKGV